MFGGERIKFQPPDIWKNSSQLPFLRDYGNWKYIRDLSISDEYEQEVTAWDNGKYRLYVDMGRGNWYVVVVKSIGNRYVTDIHIGVYSAWIKAINSAIDFMVKNQEVTE